MKRFVRLVLFFVLAVSLPFHSAYGVGMAQCMALVTAAHGEMHAFVFAPEPAVAGHDGHEGGGHRHHSAESGQPHGHGPDGGAADGSPHCGSCTTCCTSQGMTGPSQLIPQHRGYAAMVWLPEHPLSSIPARRLDRPPLTA